MAHQCFAGVLKHTFLLLLIFAHSMENQECSSDNGYPPLWHLVTDTLEKFVTQENKVVIHPWKYLDRMAMYRVLLKNTGKYFSTLGSNNSGNILWGLALQNGWQFRTERLADPSKTTTSGYENGDPLSISVKSWWACMNYYLSVIPFLAAANAGMFEDSPPYPIEIVPPGNSSTDFCYSIAGCQSSFPEVMTEWNNFYQYLKSSNIPPETMSSFSFSPELDEALYYMWTAHMASIAVAKPKCQKRLWYLSANEQLFGNSWTTTVEYIAETHFLTDFQTTNTFQSALPPRKLIFIDVPPFIPDFSSEENRVLFVIIQLNKLEITTAGLTLKKWKKAMCSEKGRSEGRQFLENIATNPQLTVQNVFEILKEFIKNQNCQS